MPTGKLEERTITESTGQRLIDSIGQLNTSMAVANEQLHTISIKFDRQEQLNDDIETRMKAREYNAIDHAARIVAIEAWKKSLNGYFIAIGTAIGVTIALGILYIVFGGVKP